MVTIEQLFESLSTEKPVVDNPAGLMHNYMARKPFNIVGKVVEALSPEKGVVYDPMAGSGTTLIEAAKRGRFAVGADVNPIANLISSVTLSKWDLEAIAKLLNDYLVDLESFNTTIYGISVDGVPAVIERCHFQWDGGVLRPDQYWYKPIKESGSYLARKKSAATPGFCAGYEAFADWTIGEIEDVHLIPNSRIAIPEGRSVHDYFCYRNLAFLDSAKRLLIERRGMYGYEVLQLLFSSSINLIKISDKKASSQIPYWIPKKNVTSRNAFFVLEKKARAILEGLSYCEEKLISHYESSATLDSVGDPCCHIFYGGAQNIPETLLPDESVDLVITDPPYTDQVPYVEYGQLTSSIMGIDLESSLREELVVSDAPSRKKTSDGFNIIFGEIMRRTHRALKTNGYVVMFYHSFDLRSWDAIIGLMSESGFSYVDQMPIPAPRKSFKTVMSPGKTLDGNYLIVFKKASEWSKATFDGTVEEAEARALAKAKEIAAVKCDSTLQTIYDGGLLKDAIERGYLGAFSKKHRTFADVMNAAQEEGSLCTGC